MTKKIKVLIVDDSALVRQSLEKIMDSDPAIEIMGMAADPFDAADKMKKEVPDVITLDVEMPRMDGITFLKKIMSQHPTPVVMCSSLVGNGCETALMALEYGAVEIIEKPKIGIKKFLEESRITICDAVKAASHVRVKPFSEKKMQVTKKLTADAVIAPPMGRAMARTTEKIGVVGASTGGVEALRVLLEAIPSDSPGIVIVQHMPEKFTKAFAGRINDLCEIEVREAKDGDRVLRGMALISPGNRHIILKRSGAQYHVEVKDGPLVCRHRPSVDVLFRSAARYAGGNAVGVIMTGMGDDGAKGLFEMKQAGAHTIAQNEESCVVFGMPQEAIKLGAVDKILPLDKIAGALLNACSK
jgi:two-component system chemotaxis response regulator CheB